MILRAVPIEGEDAWLARFRCGPCGGLGSRRIAGGPPDGEGVADAGRALLARLGLLHADGKPICRLCQIARGIFYRRASQ